MTEEDWTIRTARSLAASAQDVPDCPGVYALLGEEAYALTEANGILLPRRPMLIGGMPVFYVGRTARLRPRIRNHLAGDARCSTLRMSIGALLAPSTGIQSISTPPNAWFHFGSDERVITEWLIDHVDIAFRPHPRAESLEKRIIRTHSPILNIKEQRHLACAQSLMELRKKQSFWFKDTMFARGA